MAGRTCVVFGLLFGLSVGCQDASRVAGVACDGDGDCTLGTLTGTCESKARPAMTADEARTLQPFQIVL